MPSRRGHDEAAYRLKYSKTRVALVVTTLIAIRNFGLFTCILSLIHIHIPTISYNYSYIIYLRVMYLKLISYRYISKF